MRRLTLSTSDSPPLSGGEACRFLNEVDEQEVLSVLREQIRHEQRVTSDDVRFVVRAVASHSSSVRLPPEFPSLCWILEIKRTHNLLPITNSFPFDLCDSGPDHLDARCENSVTVTSDSSSERLETSYYEPSTFSRTNMLPSHDTVSPLQHSRQRQQQQIQHQRCTLVVDDHCAGHSWQKHEHSCGNKGLGSSGRFEGEDGATTGSSSSLSIGATTSLASLPNSNINASRDTQNIASTPL